MPGETNATPGSAQSTLPETSTPSVDFQAEVSHYLQQASSIPKSEIMVCRANTDRISSNIRFGLAAINEPEIAERIHRELPAVDTQSLMDLSRLGETVAHVARQVTPPAKTDELTVRVKQGSRIRRRFFTQIKVLVDEGLVKKEELDALRKGKGPLSLANDLIDGAALFKRHEQEIAGKIAVKPELITEGREIGLYLREHLKPNASVKPRTSDKNTGAETRDRLWTLLIRRHQELRKVASWIWPTDTDKHVPPLRAFQRKHKPQEQQSTSDTDPVPA